MPKRGFTLIELLVVVAIIAILIAVLVPSLARAREQGKSVKCESNLHTLCTALVLYTQANQDWLPEWGYNHGGGDTQNERAWLNTMVVDYGQNRGVLRCPADQSAYWTQPYKKTKKLRTTSYATNYFLCAENKNDTEIGFKAGHPFNSVRWIERPAATAFFVELVDKAYTTNDDDGDYAVADHVHTELWSTFHPQERDQAAMMVAIEHHLGQANYGFLDGHAERLPFRKTFEIEKNNDDYLQISWFYNKYDPTVAR